ncbi:MAG: hypothetical protein GX318_05530 [Clostridia bacterium]|nr:hypothetical protein [Clostridia bacterium]
MIILRKNKESPGKGKDRDHTLNRIRQLMQLNKYSEALPLLREQFQRLSNNKSGTAYSHPGAVQIHTYYGECLIHNGKLGKGLGILSKGLQRAETEKLCRESLEEKGIPYMEKQIIHQGSMAEAYEQLEIIETNCPVKIIKKGAAAFLSRAALHFKNKEFKDAVMAYKKIMAMAEKYGCLDFDNIIRAGDSNIKCGHIREAQKIYEFSKTYADTLHRQCRRHKKLADLLVLKGQCWHAIPHYLAALKCIPGDRGSKTRLRTTLKRLGLLEHWESFLNLSSLSPDLEHLEASTIRLKKELHVG